MKVLVCGSRAWTDPLPILDALRRLPRGSTVIHGGARGADLLAGTIANSLGLQVVKVAADWRNLGRSAGIRRNLAMLDMQPELVLAFWKDGSTGTAHTIREARKRGIPVEVHEPSA